MGASCFKLRACGTLCARHDGVSGRENKVLRVPLFDSTSCMESRLQRNADQKWLKCFPRRTIVRAAAGGDSKRSHRIRDLIRRIYLMSQPRSTDKIYASGAWTTTHCSRSTGRATIKEDADKDHCDGLGFRWTCEVKLQDGSNPSLEVPHGYWRRTRDLPSATLAGGNLQASIRCGQLRLHRKRALPRTKPTSAKSTRSTHSTLHRVSCGRVSHPSPRPAALATR